MLKVEKIDTYYGLSHILFEVSLEVERGEIVALLGRNGAGKSTTMKSIMGLVPPRTGKILFKERDCTGERPFRMARMGIGYVPDDRRVFSDLTVEENLEISHRCSPHGASSWNINRAYDFFPDLKAISDRKAGHLSGGEQQMLTIARALVTNPELLLLDEPTEGLAPIIVEALAERIRLLKEEGLTVLLSEQNQEVALGLSSRCYIIENGRICFHGTSEEIRRNRGISERYLGLG